MKHHYPLPLSSEYATKADLKADLLALENKLTQSMVEMEERLTNKMETLLREFSHQFLVAVGQKFDEIDKRFDRIEKTLENHERRFDRLENKLDAFIVEVRTGYVTKKEFNHYKSTLSN